MRVIIPRLRVVNGLLTDVTSFVDVRPGDAVRNDLDAVLPLHQEWLLVDSVEEAPAEDVRESIDALHHDEAYTPEDLADFEAARWVRLAGRTSTRGERMSVVGSAEHFVTKLRDREHLPS